MNNVELMETELGVVPVIVNKNVENEEVVFDGKMLYNDIKIFIQESTKSDCLDTLRIAFELQMDFWLYNELSSINIALSNE